MLLTLLLAQLAVVAPSSDTLYSSAALRDLVAAAAGENRRAPASLRSYTSHIETETSVLIRDTIGRENAAEIEQLATNARWDRGSGRYDLHVVGYRSQSVGVPYSTLSIIRSWTTPSLYGQRLSLGAFTNSQRRAPDDTLITVHPFAADRDRFYTFSGGDTVATLHAGGRSIALVRIRVRPRHMPRTRLGLFDGEIDLDAEWKQIVRMRGQFVVEGGNETRTEKVMRVAMGLTAVAYIEFVNAEVAGKYWLPASQRTEFQIGMALFGRSRPVFRIVSTISDIVTDDSGGIANDSSDYRRIAVTWAAGDTVSTFNDWLHPIGEQTSSVHSDDFGDMAPDVWRSAGPPRVELYPRSVDRIFRFNRVEGLYLGVAPSVDFRSLAPGLSSGAYGGWAFAEKTVRGGVFTTYRRNQSIFGVTAERTLASTNDFMPPYSDDPGIGALLGSVDNYDYVDRTTSTVSLTRMLGSINAGFATLQLGGGRDRSETQRITRGVFGANTFLPNRGSLDGSYALAVGDLEIHPSVSGDFVTPGIGMRLHHEIGSGSLTWQRTEIGASARQYLGPVSFSFHADAGAVVGGTIPPQKLFELGGSDLLPGYAYKQFAGDRAMLLRSFASYRFNLWKKPIRVRNFFVPGASPGLIASIAGGWTDITTAAAQRAVTQLGVDGSGNPLSTTSNGFRATVGAGVSFFSDITHIGVARPIDRAGPWRLSIGFGTTF